MSLIPAQEPDSLSQVRAELVTARQAGRIDQVQRGLEALLRLGTSERQDFVDLAYIYAYKSQLDSALRTYDQLEARYGLELSQHLERARLFYAKEQAPKAIAYLEHILQTADKPVLKTLFTTLVEWYLEEGDFSNAMRLLQEAERQHPGDPLIALCRAEFLLRGSQDAEAFVAIQQLIGHRGIELDAKAGIIYHLLDEQRFTGDSLWILSSHLVGDYPRDARAWAVAGDVAAHFRQFDEAKSAYIRAIDLNPKTPILWQQLVELLAIRGEMEEAKQVGHHASNLFPQQAEILLLTGNIFQSTDEHESARSYLEGALNVADEKHEDLMASIYSALGSTYHALKLYSASDVAFTEALLLDSLHPVALNNYAYYLAQRKDKLDKAAALAKKVVELHPGESTYEDTYAWVLYQQGNFAEALVWIRKALSRSQHPSSTLLEHYGDILYQNGKKREALVQWKLASAQLTENDDTAEQLARKIHAKKLLP